MDPDGPLPPFVTADENLAAAVDAQDHVEQKLDALRAYPTQVTTDGPFFALSNNVGTTAWGIEFYRIVKGERGELDATGSRPISSPGSELRFLAALGLLLGGAGTAVATVAAARPRVGLRARRRRRRRPRSSRCQPGWWSRLAFVVGWVAMVGWLTVPRRPEGDYLISQDWQGYARPRVRHGAAGRGTSPRCPARVGALSTIPTLTA